MDKQSFLICWTDNIAQFRNFLNFGFAKRIWKKFSKIHFFISNNQNCTNNHAIYRNSILFFFNSINCFQIILFKYPQLLLAHSQLYPNCIIYQLIIHFHQEQNLVIYIQNHRIELKLYNILIYSSRQMFDQPSWLDIQEVLYPQTLMSKTLIIESQSAPIHYENEINVIYNSYNREINITDVVNHAIMTLFSSQAKFQIQVFNYQEGKYQILGNYPSSEPLLLKGNFVQFNILRLRFIDLVKQEKSEIKLKKNEKTIREIIKIVAQWRKIYLEKSKKITLDDAANQMGIPRGTLGDYYCQIKAAQKYEFNFEQNLDKPYKFLKKFVQQKNQKKQKSSPSVMAILQKYHPQ